MTTDANTTSAIVESLHRHPFVEGFEPAFVEALARIAKPARYAGNHVILQQGDEPTQLYLITAGRVALEISGRSQPFRVDTLGAGEEFGWSWALGNPGVYQVRTLEPVEALVLSAAELSARCEADSAFGYALMRRLLGVVAERLRATRLTVIDMYLPEAKRAGT
jgi:CRP/FNR family transcriptional regulator, cyclic AMP receptor protein